MAPGRAETAAGGTADHALAELGTSLHLVNGLFEDQLGVRIEPPRQLQVARVEPERQARQLHVAHAADVGRRLAEPQPRLGKPRVAPRRLARSR